MKSEWPITSCSTHSNYCLAIFRTKTKELVPVPGWRWHGGSSSPQPCRCRAVFLFFIVTHPLPHCRIFQGGPRLRSWFSLVLLHGFRHKPIKIIHFLMSGNPFVFHAFFLLIGQGSQGGFGKGMKGALPKLMISWIKSNQAFSPIWASLCTSSSLLIKHKTKTCAFMAYPFVSCRSEMVFLDERKKRKVNIH